MPEQTQMFIRLALTGDVQMTPNKDGLFTADQVAVLAAKRYCNILKVEDYSIDIKCKVRGEWKPTKIMATDKGLWSPVEIFRACTEAAGKKVDIVGPDTKLSNPFRGDLRLNECMIASIVVRPA